MDEEKVKIKINTHTNHTQRVSETEEFEAQITQTQTHIHDDRMVFGPHSLTIRETKVVLVMFAFYSGFYQFVNGVICCNSAHIHRSHIHTQTHGFALIFGAKGKLNSKSYLKPKETKTLSEIEKPLAHHTAIDKIKAMCTVV